MRGSLFLLVLSTGLLGAFAATVSAQTCDQPRTLIDQSHTVTVVPGSTIVPGSQYPTISGAVTYANNQPVTYTNNQPDYYCIDVMPETYTNDFPPQIIRPIAIQRNPTDPTFAGQPVVLKATVSLPNHKGILLTTASLTVDSLSFTGAQIPNHLGGNGAGIRDQNTLQSMLVVRNSEFLGNQEGILTGDDFNEKITIFNSRFINNGNPNTRYFQHGLYVNEAGSLTVQNSVFCGQLIGHDVKSRALTTTIQNNWLYDGAVPGSSDPNDNDPNTTLGCNAGSSSLAIDIPNGGAAMVGGSSTQGNHIIQGVATQNYKMIDYGEEGLYNNTTNSFTLSHNTFITNGTPAATAIYDPNCVPVQLSTTQAVANDNTFTGNFAKIVDPAGCIAPPPP